MPYRILVVNPGSTSTKIGVYEDEQLLFDKTLRHSAEDIAQFNTSPAQKDWRRDLVMKALREQLLRDERSGYDVLDAAQLAEMEAYCADYKAFLTNGKTERLSVREAVAAAEAKGFVPYRRGMELKAGDRVYTCNRGKGLMLAVMGRESLAEGVQIAAAHIDSPRLDLKPNPLYEDSGLAYFKTHSYGGIR